MKKTNQLTEIAAAVALATVCSFIKVYQMPQGGSVALTMIPILLIAYRRGFGAGVITGAIYGLISLLVDFVIYHPMSILLDYVLAFGAVGIAGFFKPTKTGIMLGTTLGIGGRFVSSTLSGALLFAEYAPEGQNAWIYSIGYQATYLIPELIICLAVLLLLQAKAKPLFEVK